MLDLKRGLRGRKPSLSWTLPLAVWLCACGGVRDKVWGPGTGGDFDPCSGDPIVTPVAWIEELEVHDERGDSVMGTPADLLGPIAGECSAPIDWDASGFSDDQVTARGASEIGVQVEIDESSVRHVQRTPRNPDDDVVCAAFLEADVTVSLATEDGTFRDEGPSSLMFTAAGLQPMPLTVALEDSEGSFALDLGSGESASLEYELGATDSDCAGRIGLMVSRSSGSMGSSTAGQIGSWSKTGCPLGSTAVDLDGPDGLLPRVEALWGDRTVPAVWDDGQQTELLVEVTTSAERACDDGSGASFPVEVRYGTSDGRIELHTTEGSVRTGDGLELWVNDEFMCASEDDSLPYTRADCRVVDSITLQFALHESAASATFGLEIYSSVRDEGRDEPLDHFLEYR
ncbi:MAG: hypothetical protein OEZ06_30665 [Myxococcales bacterium]|nr:hypothetical protein [Myxococcales bacterium]